MSFLSKIIGLTGLQADVDSNNALKVSLPTTKPLAGFTRISSYNGTTDRSNELLVNDASRLIVGLDSLLYYDDVQGTTLNPRLWTNSLGTMTQTVAGDCIVLNAGLSIAANAYAIIKSVPSVIMNSRTCWRYSTRIAWTIDSDQPVEFGWSPAANVSGVAALNDGIYFRMNSDGTLRGVVAYGSQEHYTAPFTVPTDGGFHTFEFVPYHSTVRFSVDGVSVGAVDTPASNPICVSNLRGHLFCRHYNLPAPVGSPRQVQISAMYVVQAGVVQEEARLMNVLAKGLSIVSNPVAPYGQSQNYGNSTAPASASLSNTVPSYTTEGGWFQFAAPAGADTDYLLYGFLVDTGYRRIITGVKVSLWNLGATVATTPTLIQFGLGINSTALSLATVDSLPNTIGYKRIGVGAVSFPIGAPAGTAANEIFLDLSDSPLVGEAGRYCALTMRIPVGTATPSQIIQGHVTLLGSRR